MSRHIEGLQQLGLVHVEVAVGGDVERPELASQSKCGAKRSSGRRSSWGGPLTLGSRSSTRLRRAWASAVSIFMTAATALRASASETPASRNILLHVGLVGVAGGLEAGLVAEIIVAVGEAEAADADPGDHVGGVVEVLHGGEADGCGDPDLLQVR